jgi:hypothetical protein
MGTQVLQRGEIRDISIGVSTLEVAPGLGVDIVQALQPIGE